MTNHGDFSAEAKTAAHGKARAAEVFADNAAEILAALPLLADDHVLVAVVDASHEFAGTHRVPQDDIVARVPELEGDGGWAMVFTPGTSEDDVRRRAEQMATLARRRAEMITRIQARRS